MCGMPEQRRRPPYALRALLCLGGIVLGVMGSCRHVDLDEPHAKPQVAKRQESVPTAGPAPKVGEEGYARWAGFTYPSAPKARNPQQVVSMNAVCASCHRSDDHDMHEGDRGLSCVDCHGGEIFPK